jgi:hypothetical protein
MPLGRRLPGSQASLPEQLMMMASSIFEKVVYLLLQVFQPEGLLFCVVLLLLLILGYVIAMLRGKRE